MKRLLIVDDEPIIVDGLCELFAQRLNGEWEIHSAYDGFEALDCMKELFMDIVLADIEMPGMNGLALQAQAQARWPLCRFVFLTGYSDFDYVKTSIRQGAIDYVLKTEGDEAIVQAVDRAIREVDARFSREQLVAGAERKLAEALPLLRKECLLEALQGDASGEPRRGSRFRALKVKLEPEAPVHLALARVDDWRDDARSDTDRALYLYALQNIVEEIVGSRFNLEAVPYAKDRCAWLLQPIQGTVPPTSREEQGIALQNLFEAAQNSARQYMRLPCSFVVGTAARSWRELPDVFDRFKAMMMRGLGSGPEMLLTDRRAGETARPSPDGRAALKRLSLLEPYLESGDAVRFFALFDEIAAWHDAPQEGIEATAGALEIYYSLAAVFFSYLNKSGRFAGFAEHYGVGRMFSIQQHPSWADAMAYFREAAGYLFRHPSASEEASVDEVVLTLHGYIERHLHGDLSLHRLAEQVYLTPFYLSRLYKQKTGRSLSEHITDCRLGRAKELLVGSPLKIHEVGERIGFESASYFTRFFRKLTGLSPQQFRDLAQ
ncbi:helix-turn-helix domain-containing protein [Cohnella sp. JJ-181]|uniref:helix-turn-helix domain-containing protein n=1 Tax=Cohnella rhizoplanae TaxID=2974897 RepID=UPI0022FFB8EC|nr:helix-turn-helix domain-containing protein [Cohnella sp. JJ-181]CAI6061092.1 HTH-type transcriptional activator RhaR [Cohnella sp. JJ-181]